MTTALAEKTEVLIKAPELRGNNFALGACQDTEVCLDGPGGCVAGETLFYNPVTGKHTPIVELYEKKIAPFVQTLIGVIQAEVPFIKGIKKLYRVTLASGRQCVVTDDHRFLTPDGWRFLSDCAPGSQFLISSPCPRLTTEASGPSVSPLDALHLSQTPPGYQEHYSVSFHPDGVPPQTGEDTDLTAAPSPNGVHAHNHDDLYVDDQQLLPEYTRHNLQSDHLARNDYPLAYTDTVGTQSYAQPETSSPTDAWCQYASQFLQGIPPLSPTAQSLLDGDSTRPHGLSLGARLLAQEALSRDVWASLTHLPSEQYFAFSHTTPELPEVLPEWRVYSLSFNTSKCDYTIQWDTVSSIEYERTDEYFDLHVPIAEHYLAEGIWHHNTGKTYAILYKIHVLLHSYPGSKWLVCRKYNVDLGGSALATYRDAVLHPSENVRYFGGSKDRPPGYMYPNGSFMAISGLDRPSKLKSFECDGVFINEATECDIDDLETARMRLRKGVIPYQQIILDTNPDSPYHWLNLRMNDGVTTRLVSRHEDNPRYFDLRTNDWTDEGRKYIFDILEGLTGVRLARYRYGIWAAAEGTVYEDSWDRKRNVIDRFPIPKEWPRYLCVDFGYTNPFVCKWYARDGDGRLFCYRELYRTKRLVEDHVKQIQEVSRWGQDGGDPFPREVICDTDAEDRMTFERHSGLMTTPAHKSVSDGIQATAARYRAAGDGKPRLSHFRDALIERDPDLVARKKPTCTIEEVDGYVWKQTPTGVKEEPVKEDDHGMDTDRYMVARFDLQPTGVTYFKDIWR